LGFHGNVVQFARELEILCGKDPPREWRTEDAPAGHPEDEDLRGGGRMRELVFHGPQGSIHRVYTTFYKQHWYEVVNIHLKGHEEPHVAECMGRRGELLRLIAHDLGESTAAQVEEADSELLAEVAAMRAIVCLGYQLKDLSEALDPDTLWRPEVFKQGMSLAGGPFCAHHGPL